MTSYRRIAWIALLAATPLVPLAAQARDSVRINYANQTIQTILNALIDAGGLNVSASNVPTRSTTLTFNTPIARDAIADVLIAFATQNGMKVSGDSTGRRTFMIIEGPAPNNGPTPAQLQQQALAATQLGIHVYRLKHASAVTLAPVLQNLFTGTGTTGVGGNALPGGAPGAVTFQVNPGQGGAGGGAGGGAAGGRGGRGGGGAAGGGNAGGGGGNANAAIANILGGGGGGRGGGGAANALGALAQLAQGGPGIAALSASSQFIRILAEESTNSLIVRSTDADFQLIQSVLTGVDLRPLQVLIEVTIAEVTRTHDLNVGVAATVQNAPKSTNGTTVAGSQVSTAGDRDFILQLAGGKGTIDFNLAINALQSRGDLRIASLPVIIAENNRQAVLNVGSSRPFVQVSQSVTGAVGGVVQTIQYLDVGTVLTITPTINPDGFVNMIVSQTDNSATNEIAFDAPVLSKREVTTQVFVANNQTTVLGGLAATTKSRTKSGIPFLSDIPWIGGLFRNTKALDETTELFLFLTPHVLFSDEDTERMLKALREGSDLLKQIDITPRIRPLGDTLAAPPLIVRPRTDTTAAGRGRGGRPDARR